MKLEIEWNGTDYNQSLKVGSNFEAVLYAVARIVDGQVVGRFEASYDHGEDNVELSVLSLEGAKTEVLREVGRRLSTSLDAVYAALDAKNVLR